MTKTSATTKTAQIFYQRETYNNRTAARQGFAKGGAGDHEIQAKEKERMKERERDPDHSFLSQERTDSHVGNPIEIHTLQLIT
jgi:hypothetical protein